jgi:hypothetical protein
MNWKLMFKGDYMAAIEFGNRQFGGEIASVKLCKLEGDDGRQKEKGVVYFKGNDKGWVLCKTNAMCLAAMFGEDTTTWVGKRVTLYATMVSVGKEKQPGIRVKGSPDLTKPIPVTIKLPRKKAFTVTMQPTGKGGAAPVPEPAPEEPSDEEMAAASALADAQGGEPISF